MGWKENLFQKYLLWKARPQKLQRYLRSKMPGRPGSKATDEGDKKLVRAAAVQIKIRLHGDPLNFADEMHRLVKEAAGRGAELVAFPEYNGLQLLGMLPGVEKMADEAEAATNKSENKEGTASYGEYEVMDVLRFIAPLMEKTVLTTFSSLASGYGVYIMTGSQLCLLGEQLLNRAHLFDPAGRLAGIQDKVHLFPTEREWGIQEGYSFEAFHTSIGKLAMPVCMDATYFETFRILSLLGARIFIVPIANAEPYNYYLALRGIWPRVQESQVFGVKSALVGKLLGFKFTGRAGVFCPLELSREGDGVLAETSQHSETDLVLAELDLEELEKLRRTHPLLGDTNPALYRSYFPRVYESAPQPAHRLPGNAKTQKSREE